MSSDKPQIRVLVIRVEIAEGDYAEARQFYSDREIRETIVHDGLQYLLNEVRMAAARMQRDGL